MGEHEPATSGSNSHVHLNCGESFSLVIQVLQERQYHSHWTLKKNVAVSGTPFLTDSVTYGTSPKHQLFLVWVENHPPSSRQQVSVQRELPGLSLQQAT